MAIESTFMKYGHSKSGIVGITLKPETLKTWAYSLHACHSIMQDLNEMRDNDGPQSQTHHKEESAAIIRSDETDRVALCEKLSLCVDPLDPKLHPDGLINIATGQFVTHPSVNVEKAVQLGQAQMETFEQHLPDGFHDTISKCYYYGCLTQAHQGRRHQSD